MNTAPAEPMRILYASERPPYPFFLGGAARCAHELLRRLSSDFHVECQAVGSAAFCNPSWAYPSEDSHSALGIRAIREEDGRRIVDCGYPVRVLEDFEHSLEVIFDEFSPDVVWTQMEGAHQLAEIARRKHIPCLYFIHDAELPDRDLKQLAELGCEFVASSQFLARKAGCLLKQRIEVVYPCPRLDFGVSGDPDGYVTMINPHRVKGVETFYKIACAMPDKQFLLLESWKLNEQQLEEVQQQLEGLPNVEFHRRVSDMAVVYGYTRLLIVPSVWEEGFGMVVVEAQSCGIPVIASNRGGLPEAVGAGGLLIDDYRNPDEWMSAIMKVVGESSSYQEYVGRALANVREDRFRCEHSARVIFDVLWQMTSAKGKRPKWLKHLEWHRLRLLEKLGVGVQ